MDGIMVDRATGQQYDAVILRGSPFGTWHKVAVSTDAIITPVVMVDTTTFLSPSGRFQLVVHTEA